MLTRLKAYFDAYIERRHDLAWESVQTLKHTRNAAVAFFGADRSMKSITIGEAKDYHRHAGKTLAIATVAMHIKKLRQVWADAIDHKLLEDNPWKKVRAGSQVNAERQVYVPVADILRVIDACPNSEWKLLFALARFAGMRIPSEPRQLRWRDINFDAGRILVHSSKTKHHPGKATRTMPMMRDVFPKLESLLLMGMTKDDGAEYVLPRLRLHQNLATMGKIFTERAGLAPWPRFWQNLRSSCETDLASRFPIHVVCQWIGNSAGVAMKHYLQVTENHFDAANGDAQMTHAKPSKVGFKTIQKTGETYDFDRSLQEHGITGNFLEISQAQHQAMQALLRRVKRKFYLYNRQAIANLRQGVRAAQRRTRGRK